VTARMYTQADTDAASDNPELTAEQIGAVRPFAEAFPELAKTIRKRGPGKKPPKVNRPFASIAYMGRHPRCSCCSAGSGLRAA